MSGPLRRSSTVHIRGRSDWDKLTNRQREARHRAFDAIGLMRSEGVSLNEAAKRSGTSAKAVHRYASDALRKDGGRYKALPSDRSYHRMSTLSIDGVGDVDVRGSKARSLVGRHWNAIQRYAATGDVRLLQRFAETRVGGVTLESDPDAVERLLRRGQIDLDDIYVTRP